MAVSTDYKRLFLRGIRWDAQEKGLTLFTALKRASLARITDTQDGRVLTSLSQNGQSSTFTLPANGRGITPADAAELCSRMLDLYDKCKAELIAAGTPKPTDDAIQARMMLLLVPVRNIYPDFRRIREVVAV